MKKKAIAVIIAAIQMIMCFSQLTVVYASTYSTQLHELENLIEQCEARGFSVEYEKINYETIKRLQNNEMPENFPYQAEDLMDTDKYTAYYEDCMENLYEQTKTNLEGYLDGTLIPKKVEAFDINNATIKGKVLKDGEDTVFSVGYGHFDSALREIGNFNNIGATNVQTQLGPDYINGSEFGWAKMVVGGVDVETSVVNGGTNVKSGDYSFRINNKTAQTGNKYYRIYKTISCEPGATYEFGVWTKGRKHSADISADSFNSTRHQLTVTESEWSENKFTYTAGESQNTFTMHILVEGACDLYIDDLFVYKLSAGKRTGENLIFDAGFESGDKYYANLYNLITALDIAKENNVGISLLLSPHYLTASAHNLPSNVYISNGGFLKYNIDAPETRKVIKEYISILGNELNKYDLTALQNICLSNEPSYKTTTFPDFYNPKYREYLHSIHGSISSLNSAYGTSYTSFEDVSMPTDLDAASGAVFYDWMNFNDKVFADWHKWMAEEVKRQFPNIPVSSKVLGITLRTEEDEDSRSILSMGTDYELFNEFSDYAGVDTSTWVTDIDTYYRTSMTYDYLRTITGKPIYDSEHHIIGDEENQYKDKLNMHVGNVLWMGAVHGRSMSTLWQWSDETATGSNFGVRPDIVANVGRVSLDMIRLSDKLEAINNDVPEVAILYSKPTRVYDNNYSQGVFYTYKSLINGGFNVGFVTDRSIGKVMQYKTLIVPDVEYCKEQTLVMIEDFIKKGGKVICLTRDWSSSNILSKNEYGQSLDNSSVLSQAKVFTFCTSYSTVNSNLIKDLAPAVTVELNGSKLKDVDFRYVINDGKMLLSITNLNYSNAKSGVKVKLNGKEISGMKDLITEKEGIDSIQLNGFAPMLLEYDLPESVDIQKLRYNDGKLGWSYTGEDYLGANISRVNNEGIVYKPTFVTTNEFEVQEGTYFVSAVDAVQGDSAGAMISVAKENTFDMEVLSATIGKNKFNVTYKVENTADYICFGIACIELLDESDSVIDCSYQHILLKPGESNSAKINGESFGASNLRICVYDSLQSKNLLSNIIVKP